MCVSLVATTQNPWLIYEFYTEALLGCTGGELDSEVLLTGTTVNCENLFGRMGDARQVLRCTSGARKAPYWEGAYKAYIMHN